MNKSLLTDAERQVLALRIQRNYDYSPTAGLLINRRRNRLLKGFTRGKNCYKSTHLLISGKSVNLTYHHIVWVWHKGYWPTQLDHINGDKMDDRIENLQVVSGSYNIKKDHKRKEIHGDRTPIRDCRAYAMIMVLSLVRSAGGK